MRKIIKHTRPGRVDPSTGRRKPVIRWQVITQEKNGPRRYKTFITRAEAEDYRDEQHRQQKGGLTVDPNRTLGRLCDRADSGIPPGPPDRADITPEFRRSVFAEDLKPKSRADYEDQLRRILRHFGGRRLQTISAADVEQFRDQLRQSIREGDERRLTGALARAERKLAWAERSNVDPSPYRHRVEAIRERLATIDRSGLRTTAKTVGMMRRLLAWAQSRQYVGTNVAAGVRKPRHKSRIERSDRDRAYSAQEARALIAAADPGMAQTALQILIFGGLRIGELRAVCWDDVEFASNRIYVRRTAGINGRLTEPKTPNAVRAVPIPKFVAAALRRWKLACPPSPLELVFPTATGAVMDYANFRQRSFQPAQRRAGLRALPLHGLRHTAASLWLAANVEVEIVSRLLGHADASITHRVYHHAIERRSAANPADKLETFLDRENDCELTARRSSAA